MIRICKDRSSYCSRKVTWRSPHGNKKESFEAHPDLTSQVSGFCRGNNISGVGCSSRKCDWPITVDWNFNGQNTAEESRSLFNSIATRYPDDAPNGGDGGKAQE